MDVFIAVRLLAHLDCGGRGRRREYNTLVKLRSKQKPWDAYLGELAIISFHTGNRVCFQGKGLHLEREMVWRGTVLKGSEVHITEGENKVEIMWVWLTLSSIFHCIYKVKGSQLCSDPYSSAFQWVCEMQDRWSPPRDNRSHHDKHRVQTVTCLQQHERWVSSFLSVSLYMCFNNWRFSRFAQKIKGGKNASV